MDEIRVGMVIEEYEFVEQIEKTAESATFIVRSKNFSRQFLAKVSFVNDDHVDRVWRIFDSEIRALSRLDHPNVIKLYGHFRHVTSFVLILEYCPNGNLLDYIQKAGSVRTPVMVRLIKEICSAVNHTWSRGVQHRDIRPANIMFDENGRVKLAGFGGAIIVENDGNKKKRHKKAPGFRCFETCAAPELLLKKKKCDATKGDIWAIGVTILWMVKGDVPWAATDREQLIRIVTNVNAYVPKKSMCQSVYNILSQMLVVSPNMRTFPTDEELAKLGDDDDRANDAPESKDSVAQVIERGKANVVAKPGPLQAGLSLRMLYQGGRGSRAADCGLPGQRRKQSETVAGEMGLDQLSGGAGELNMQALMGDIGDSGQSQEPEQERPRAASVEPAPVVETTGRLLRKASEPAKSGGSVIVAGIRGKARLVRPKVATSIGAGFTSGV